MFFGDPRIKQWAESLATMTYNFRLHYIGIDGQDAISQIRDSWHGSQVAEVSEDAFAVKHESNLEPFVFFFQTPKTEGGKVKMILVEANPPFANVVLAVSESTTNYLLRDPKVGCNKKEKELCKALEKNGIPKGSAG